MTDQPFDIFALPVHPAAEEFPMMPEDELKALGADIKANGLKHPILVGRVQPGPWTLDDGRNRREACRIAGVHPTIEYQEYRSEDEQIRRIWSENGQRRNMTKGARAMVAARIFPQPEKGGRGKKSLTIKEFGINTGPLSQARTVIRYAPELVDDVKADRRSLVEAYGIAKYRKQKKRLAEDSLRRLREAAPDLADRVADEADALTLDPAWAIVRERSRSRSPEAPVAVERKVDVPDAAARSVAKATELTSDNRDTPRKERDQQPVEQPSAAWTTEHEAGANIRQHSRRIIKSIRAIGKELLEVKTKLSETSFSEWLQQELGCSAEDAQSFIEVLDRLKDEDTDERGAIRLSGLLNIVGSRPVKTAGSPELGLLAAE